MTRARRRTWTALLIALATAGATALPALAAPRRDDGLWKAAEAAREGQLKLLETVVNIDSGTGDVEGGRRVLDVLAPRLEALGARIERVPAEIPGLPDNLVATLKGKGKARILMIGHVDTVFEPGTTAKWRYVADGNRATGPGVGDEKGGVVQAITALEILSARGFQAYDTLTLLVETSEERGSPGTRALIDRLVKSHDVELNLEPGDAPDKITVWRKGSSTFNIDVKGRPAHAGVAPQDGRNAATELVHQLATLDGLPKSGDGLTANLTIIQAGSRYNVIPENARAQVNVRIRDKADLDRVQATLEESARNTKVPDTRVTVSRENSFPPLPDNAHTDALAVRAKAIYAELGRDLGTGGNGGASESALSHEAGTPALDGMGPVGGGFHTDKEWIDLSSVTPRTYLLMRMIQDLSARPPKRFTPAG
jgi:glutamate carboxypeptidase